MHSSREGGRATDAGTHQSGPPRRRVHSRANAVAFVGLGKPGSQVDCCLLCHVPQTFPVEAADNRRAATRYNHRSPFSKGLSMYAIIRAGGKQTKVKAGDVIEIERVKDAADSLTFTPLLVVGDDGKTVSDRSILSDSKVVAEVLGETQGDKIDIFKYKNKTGYRRHMGHRQKYTQIRVTSIDLPKATKATKATKSTKKAANQPSEQPVDETGED